MKARYWLLLIMLGVFGVTGWKLVEWRNQPPEVPFTRAMRETIESAVSTNGKVEPEEWAVARAESGGSVARILVQLNQQVAAGAPLVEIDTSAARAEIDAADAKIATARAEVSLYEGGGRAADRALLNAQIDNLKVQLAQAQRDYEAEVTAEQKAVATKQQVTDKRAKVEQIQQQIVSLQQQMGALVTPADRQAAEARLREAQSARDAAELRVRKSTVLAPIAGIVYRFELKPGAYLNPGDEVASIGRLDRVHVKVFVDEPDLGRVAVGKPVTITWDAAPGRMWTGKVNRMPVRIEELGTRQVGEVICVIDNPGRDLLPGTNVTAVILSETKEDAITIPKESLFRADGQTGVYVLEGDRVTWRAVTQGVSNVTRVQVHELKDGDVIALPSQVTLSNGMVVRPQVDATQ